MGRVPLEVAGQVDDGDGLEGALFDADAAPDAQLLGDCGDPKWNQLNFNRKRQNFDLDLQPKSQSQFWMPQHFSKEREIFSNKDVFIIVLGYDA